MIELESVSKVYAGDIWALRDCDLKVGRGDRLVEREIGE